MAAKLPRSHYGKPFRPVSLTHCHLRCYDATVVVGTGIGSAALAMPSGESKDAIDPTMLFRPCPQGVPHRHGGRGSIRQAMALGSARRLAAEGLPNPRPPSDLMADVQSAEDSVFRQLPTNDSFVLSAVRCIQSCERPSELNWLMEPGIASSPAMWRATGVNSRFSAAPSLRDDRVQYTVCIHRPALA